MITGLVFIALGVFGWFGYWFAGSGWAAGIAFLLCLAGLQSITDSLNGDD